MTRPFHFAVLFWGEHYRNHYFLDCWLRSMLAPLNLPLLDSRDGHKLIIATTKEDWSALVFEPLVQQASHHVTLRWVEIDHPTYKEDDNIRTGAIIHQHKWMGELLRQTHDPNAYGSVWSPDCIVSNGLVFAMWKWRDLKYDCVICPVLRQAEEPLLAELGDQRVLGPRKTADLSIRHLHRELWPFIEPVHRRMTHAPYRIWKMPDGLLIHGFFGLPVFMDYAVVSREYRDGNIDTCLRTGNFAACRKVHIVHDSDELSVLSLTPADFKNYPEFPEEPLSRWNTLANVRTAYKFFGTDHVRRQMWKTPIRWHSRPLNTEWYEKEQTIESELSSAISNWPMSRLRFDVPMGMKAAIEPVVEKLREAARSPLDYA